MLKSIIKANKPLLKMFPQYEPPKSMPENKLRLWIVLTEFSRGGDSILIRPNYVLLNTIYNVQQALRATLNRLIMWTNQLRGVCEGGDGHGDGRAQVGAMVIFLLVSLWERLAPDADCLGSRTQQDCWGALINRNLGASGALEIAHTPRVQAVMEYEATGSNCLLPCLALPRPAAARLQYDDKFLRLLHFWRRPVGPGRGGRSGGSVVNDFDKWLPFFNVTFCGHATAAGGEERGGSRERLRLVLLALPPLWPMKRKFWNWNHE